MKYSNLEYLKEFPLFTEETWQFAVVANEKNISKAAEFIGVTQPQLSKSMAALESRLGETLLIRRSRGVELTSAGEALLQKIQSLILFFSETSDAAGSFRRVRIGFHQSIAMRIYPQIIHPMNMKKAQFKVETEFATSLEVTRRVADLQLDFGFVINPQKNPDIIARKLESDVVGIFSQGKQTSNSVLYYNPAMINIQRVLKRFEPYHKVPLADYEVIAETAKNQDQALAVLPLATAKRYDLELIKDGKLFSVDMAIIAHRDRLKIPALKSLFHEMQARIPS